MRAPHASRLGTTCLGTALVAGMLLALSPAQAQETATSKSGPRPAFDSAAALLSPSFLRSSLFQGLGALQIIGSFIFPETASIIPETRAVALTIANGDGTPAVSFRVMPTQVARGSGLVAFGEF